MEQKSMAFSTVARVVRASRGFREYAIGSSGGDQLPGTGESEKTSFSPALIAFSQNACLLKWIRMSCVASSGHRLLLMSMCLELEYQVCGGNRDRCVQSLCEIGEKHNKTLSYHKIRKRSFMSEKQKNDNKMTRSRTFLAFCLCSWKGFIYDQPAPGGCSI